MVTLKTEKKNYNQILHITAETSLGVFPLNEFQFWGGDTLTVATALIEPLGSLSVLVSPYNKKAL